MPNAAPPREGDPEHGRSLAEAGRHTGAALRRLALGTATALAAAHQTGTVHGDLNPANILLTGDDPHLTGFNPTRLPDTSATDSSGSGGSSSGTGSGGGYGSTPAYLAPEQLAGSDVGPAADVFAWGCVIVSAATGTPPFGDDSVAAVTGRIRYAEPWLGDLPEPLRSVVLDCLAKDPADRPAMREVLTRLAAGPQPVRRPVRAPLLAVTAAVVALAVAVAALWDLPLTGGPSSPEIAAHAGESPSAPRESAWDETLATRRATRRPKSRTTRPTTRSRPTTTSGPTRASFSLAHLRVRGSSKVDHGGVTCYTGSMVFGVGIATTRPAAPYSYQWIQDGKVVESGSSRMPSGSRSDYVAARRMRPRDGRHRVTFRITSPVARTESVTFAMCRP
ncbi:serine/threonine-protein kinase [Nonomuraea glycinis]|uniref:serine/threonine-protein kinase n=1 Tax=Nonomuraea glycinis TaxID=2047744 RepID=UPI0033BDD5EE